MELFLRHYGDPILLKKGKKVDSFGQPLEELVSQMIQIMHEHEGIGLAAQQVGLAQMICIIEVQPDPEKPHPPYKLDGKEQPLELWMPCALINPEIVEYSRGKTSYEEGCLSFPGIRGQVIRPEHLTVHFQDTEGNAHVLECGGLLARVIQHEVDHLNGILFIDRMEKRFVLERAAKIKKLKRQTRDFLKKNNL